MSINTGSLSVSMATSSSNYHTNCSSNYLSVSMKLVLFGVFLTVNKPHDKTKTDNVFVLNM